MSTGEVVKLIGGSYKQSTSHEKDGDHTVWICTKRVVDSVDMNGRRIINGEQFAAIRTNYNKLIIRVFFVNGSVTSADEITVAAN